MTDEDFYATLDEFLNAKSENNLPVKEKVIEKEKPFFLTGKEYLHKLKIAEIKYEATPTGIELTGGTEHALKQCQQELKDNPDLEVRLILLAVVSNKDLLDSLQERACIRYAEGYSDSLYNAVLANIDRHDLLKDKRSEKSATQTDWQEELKRYTHEFLN